MGKQENDVIVAMKKNGGYATFGQLNQIIDFSSWGTKTPFASVRRIVQQSPAFFRIQPGLWALKEFEPDILEQLNINSKDELSKKNFTHGYYQGLLIEIGNMRRFKTYIPPQDKNKLYLSQKLKEVASDNKPCEMLEGKRCKQIKENKNT